MRSLVVISLAGIGCGRSDFDRLHDAGGDAIARAGCTTQLASHGDQVCALREDHTVWCWGDNAKHQLGDGTDTPSTIPIQVPISNVMSISGGEDTTCAITSSGELYCWGANEVGQVGNGTMTNQPIPQRITGLPPIAQVALGEWHACAIDTSGSLWCWGNNANGEVGDASLVEHDAPFQTAVHDVTAVQVSDHLTCVRDAVGNLSCFGRGDNGELGDGTLTASQPTPVGVHVITNVTAFAGGCHRHTCAVTGSEAWCWGNDDHGQLGDGTSGFNNVRAEPQRVQGLPVGTVEVSAGVYSSCARGVDGHVRCWGGEDGFPSLGNGTTIPSLAPVVVFTIDDAVQLQAQCGGACVIRSDATVWCWGTNVGNGTKDAASPVRADVPCD